MNKYLLDQLKLVSIRNSEQIGCLLGARETLIMVLPEFSSEIEDVEEFKNIKLKSDETKFYISVLSKEMSEKYLTKMDKQIFIVPINKDGKL